MSAAAAPERAAAPLAGSTCVRAPAGASVRTSACGFTLPRSGAAALAYNGRLANTRRIPVKATLRALVAQAIDALRAAGTLPADAPTPEFVIERPKTPAPQGDFSTNAAMLLAKAAKSNPRAIAQALVEAPAGQYRHSPRVEIAGRLHHFHLAEAAWREQVARC